MEEMTEQQPPTLQVDNCNSTSNPISQTSSNNNITDAEEAMIVQMTSLSMSPTSSMTMMMDYDKMYPSPTSYAKDFCPPTRTLIQHIRRRDWNEARMRILTYPYDAYYKTMSGNSSTPLHLVCLYRAPINVVELLLEANPTALLAQDAEGWTPVHLVLLYGGDEEIAMMLIRRGGAPAASLLSPYVGSPLHLACRHGSCTRIMDLLLSANQSMASIANENGTKPAAFVWNNFARNPLNERIIQQLRQTRQWNISASNTSTENKDDEDESSGNGASPGRQNLQSTVDDLLRRMVLLIRAAKREDDACYDFEVTLSLVYDLLSYQSQLGDLSQVIALIARIFPDQMKYRDTITGNHPLHVASLHPSLNSSKHAHLRQYYPRLIDPCKMESIEVLVKSFPLAATTPNHMGELPIHLALKQGKRKWETGISALVDAESDTLLLRDPATNLYPFQLAAAYPAKEDVDAIGTIFQLLTSCPHALEH